MLERDVRQLNNISFFPDFIVFVISVIFIAFFWFYTCNIYLVFYFYGYGGSSSCTRAFFIYSKRELLVIVMQRLLIPVASLLVEHRLLAFGLQ